MKCFGSGVMMKSNVISINAVSPIECLHYSLNVPVAVQITGINSKMLLDQAFAAVKLFKPMSQTQIATLLAKSEQDAMNGKYELFKTTAHFDSTSRHPDWLGADSEAVQKLAPQLPG